MQSFPLGENDPAIYLSWDDDTLALFLVSANGGGQFPPRPAYLPAGPLTLGKQWTLLITDQYVDLPMINWPAVH